MVVIYARDESGMAQDHPRIAALLLGFAEGGAGEPRRRVPPVGARRQQFQIPDQVIAAAQMGQFMKQERLPWAPARRSQSRPGRTSSGRHHSANSIGGAEPAMKRTRGIRRIPRRFERRSTSAAMSRPGTVARRTARPSRMIRTQRECA